MEELLGAGNGYPLTRSASGAGFEILTVVVAVFGGLKTELDTGGRRLDVGSEFRFRVGLEPEQPTETETRDQNDASQQGPKAL
jgi:hypothetical protein